MIALLLIYRFLFSSLFFAYFLRRCHRRFVGFYDEARFVKSRRFNKVDLVIDGFLYSKVCDTNRSTFWRCRQARSTQYKCKCRAVTREIDGRMRVKLSQSSGQHNHFPLNESILSKMQYVEFVKSENTN